MGERRIEARGERISHKRCPNDVRVVALCDWKAKHLERAKGFVAERYGNAERVHADFRELHLDARLDAVFNGKHVYREKPMRMSFAESRHVRAAGLTRC